MLDHYYKNVGRRPLLKKEQEVELSKKIESGDRHARDIMIESNLRLAISIAKKFHKPGMSLEDLIQEANIGLMKAVDKFDWRKGFRFSTYGTWWITQSVRRHISDQSSTIRIPSHAKSLYYKIQKAKIEYFEEFGSQPTEAEIAELLGVSVGIVNDVKFTPACTMSIDDKIGKDEGSSVLKHNSSYSRRSRRWCKKQIEAC